MYLINDVETAVIMDNEHVVIVAGSRDLNRYDLVCDTIKSYPFKITKLIAGGASGIDLNCKMYAKKNNIPYQEFKADWGKFGRAAGPIRNKEMAKNADGLIVIHHNSPGSLSMKKEATLMGLAIVEIVV